MGISGSDGGIVVKRPLESIIKEDPFFLLRNGELTAAELSQEHKLLFTHLSTLSYMREHNLSQKLESIYSKLIYDLLRNIIIPDSLNYLALSNSSKLSSEDFAAYNDFARKNYPLSTDFPIHHFYEACREHIKK